MEIQFIEMASLYSKAKMHLFKLNATQNVQLFSKRIIRTVKNAIITINQRMYDLLLVT